MKILLVSFSIHGAMGDFFRGIAHSLEKKHNVSMLTNSEVDKLDFRTDEFLSIRLDRKKPYDFLNPISFLKIRRFVRSFDYDVAVICSPHPFNLFVFNILNKKKIVTFVHDHELHSGVSGIDAWFLKKNLVLSYKKSAQIIVSCEWMKNEIRKKRLISDTTPINVVYLGLLENFCFPIEKMDQDIDVLFFGRIEFYKGLDILFQVAKRMPEINFVIVGKGNLKATFNIDEIPSNCTHVNEYVPDGKLAKMIQRSKMVVLPYRDATGTQTIQTIFYYSRPVIVSSVGCFPEYVDNGVNGIVVKPCDVIDLEKAIRRLLADNQIQKDMGHAGREKVEKIFSNESILHKYEAIFQSIKESVNN